MDGNFGIDADVLDLESAGIETNTGFIADVVDPDVAGFVVHCDASAAISGGFACVAVGTGFLGNLHIGLALQAREILAALPFVIGDSGSLIAGSLVGKFVLSEVGIGQILFGLAFGLLTDLAIDGRNLTSRRRRVQPLQMEALQIFVIQWLHAMAPGAEYQYQQQSQAALSSPLECHCLYPLRRWNPLDPRMLSLGQEYLSWHEETEHVLQCANTITRVLGILCY